MQDKCLCLLSLSGSYHVPCTGETKVNTELEAQPLSELKRNCKCKTFDWMRFYSAQSSLKRKYEKGNSVSYCLPYLESFPWFIAVIFTLCFKPLICLKLMAWKGKFIWIPSLSWQPTAAVITMIYHYSSSAAFDKQRKGFAVVCPDFDRHIPQKSSLCFLISTS